MKREEITALGITDKDVLDKIMALHGADIEKQKGTLSTITTDRDDLKAKLEDANKQIEQFKTLDVDSIQKAADEWKAKYEKEKADRDAADSARTYDDAANAALSDVKFSSKAAKSAFIATLKEKQLKIDGGKLIGFDDVLKQAQTDDPTAFASDKPKPQFTDPITGNPVEVTKEAFQKMTYMEKLKIKTEQPEIYKGLTQK